MWGSITIRSLCYGSSVGMQTFVQEHLFWEEALQTQKAGAAYHLGLLL